MKKIVTTLILIAAVIVSAMALSACANKTEVEKVELNIPDVTLEVGEEFTLTATVSPDNATDKSVLWTSSDSNVVTVDNGKVTAVGAGTATVTATACGKSAECTVTVKEPILQVAGKTFVFSISTYEITGNYTEEEEAWAKQAVAGNNAHLPGMTWTFTTDGKFTQKQPGHESTALFEQNGTEISFGNNLNELKPAAKLEGNKLIQSNTMEYDGYTVTIFMIMILSE